MRKDNHDISLLENRCQESTIKLNELQSQNKGLRKEIDTWRKQLKNQCRVNKVYGREIGKAVEDIKKLN